jgi:hypothetical protein
MELAVSPHIYYGTIRLTTHVLWNYLSHHISIMELSVSSHTYSLVAVLCAEISSTKSFSYKILELQPCINTAR